MWALLECSLTVVAFFFVLVVFTEMLPPALKRVVPDHTFHGNAEIDGQSVLRLLGFTLGTALVTWAAIRLAGRVQLGLQLQGWRRSLALVALPYGLCVAGALLKPGSWPLEATLALLVLGLNAAIAEEVLFRGLIMHRLARAGFSTTAVLTLQALFFGLAHVPSYGPRWWTATPLAIFCGVARQYSGSLVGPIALHGTRVLFLVAISDEHLAKMITSRWIPGLSVLWYLGFVAIDWRRARRRREMEERSLLRPTLVRSSER